MNSALQNILHCYDAIQHVMSHSHTGPIYSLFQQFARDYWSNPNRVLSPAHLKHLIGERAPQFAGHDQGDAQEFMTVLIDELYEQSQRHVEIRSICHDQSTILQDRDQFMIRVIDAWSSAFALKYSNLLAYFYGMQCIRYLCPNCKTVKDRFETFNMIPLELTTVPTSLSELIHHSGAAEHMIDASATCDNCTESVHYWREIRYVCLPKYVFLHIKRFHIDFHHGQVRHSKNVTPVIIDSLTVSLRSITIGYDEDYAEYQIKGAIIHRGNMQNGHYIFIWNTLCGTWILYDDDKIHMINEDIARRLIQEDGYVITFERRQQPPYRT